MFYYYKPWMKEKTNSKEPTKKVSKRRMTAKEWYYKLYDKYDLVINIDGKSMEDQENIWKNWYLRKEAKRLTLGVEAKSGIIVGIWIEKSHNKSNAWKIIKEIYENVKTSFGEDKNICFITDAGSEYLNNKDLRWLEITNLEITKMTEFLVERWHWRRITRRPEDNSFVENKNDYIERTCLDNYEIQRCDKLWFACLLDMFIDRNNSYLKWSKKSFRWKWITPEENIVKRFWKISANKWISWLHGKYIEKIYWLITRYKNLTTWEILKKIKFNTKPMLRRTKNAIFYDEKIMHPKSLDSSKILF